MRHSLALLTALLTSSGVASADVVQINGTIVQEAELDRTLISKPSWLRGLHFKSDALLDDTRPSLLAVIPKDWAGAEICARITSIRGDYAAMVEFDVSTDLEGNLDADLALELESAMARKISVSDSGVVVEKGKCVGDSADAGTDGEYVANFWNQASEPSVTGNGDATILMRMNIARADQLEARATLGDKEIATDCEKLTGPEVLAYNYSCSFDVPVALLTEIDRSEVTFSYERVYRGRYSETRTARIIIGAGQ